MCNQLIKLVKNQWPPANLEKTVMTLKRGFCRDAIFCVSRVQITHAIASVNSEYSVADAKYCDFKLIISNLQSRHYKNYFLLFLKFFKGDFPGLITNNEGKI